MRNYKIDSIKGILIYLVVFGHLLELVYKDNPIAKGIYLVIYAFHMPLFIFTTGYFAGCHIKKLILNIAYPYVIFSILYQLCAVLCWKNIKSFSLTTPYWLLWYLLATFVWSLTIPLWEEIKGKWKPLFLIISLGISCLAGYCVEIGRNFSLSRIVVFFPFFVLGKYWRHYDKNKVKKQMPTSIVYIMLILAIMSVIILFVGQDKIRITWLYEATPYAVSRYHAGIRLLHLLSAFLSVCLVMKFMPEKQIKCISETGRHTMTIFLLHGFVIKTLDYFDVVKLLGIVDKKVTAVMLCALTAAALVFALSSKPVERASAVLISPWRIFEKTDKER